MKRVRYIFPTSYHYRLPFHERVRAILSRMGVDYSVIYCAPQTQNLLRGDTVEIDWGTKVKSTRLPGRLVYQHALIEALQCDLAIVQQESRLALNYLLSFAHLAGWSKLAFFGHGRNFQSRNPGGPAERWKQFWATKCDWWFGYTEETRAHIEALGFPRERITVFNNAIDGSALQETAENISESELDQVAAAIGLAGRNVGVFVGGLYSDKRVEFLVAAGDLVREKVPDFELLVIGGGTDLPMLKDLASNRPWLRTTGPRFGWEKVALMRSAKLFLMPGLVGLAVLDAASLALPMVTTAWPWHSPEIAYVRNGVNGVIVEDWESPKAYAEAVVGLLTDDARRARLSEGARVMATLYSIENMAERFAYGVLSALQQKKRSQSL